MQRFRREARPQAGGSTQISSRYSISARDEGLPFLIMEFVEGDSLTTSY